MAIISLRDLLVAAICLTAVYVPLLVLYRIYFSPLSKFPGPKIAAATLWYEYYYDVVKRGRYTWKIAELHKEFGTDTNRTSRETYKDNLFTNLIRRAHCSHQSL